MIVGRKKMVSTKGSKGLDFRGGFLLISKLISGLGFITEWMADYRKNNNGPVAQLGEHHVRNVGVGGSIPLCSILKYLM